MGKAGKRAGRRAVVRGIAAGGTVMAALSGLTLDARAECVRDGATASPNGYEETVTGGRTDRTVNVSADVADGIDITLSAGGNIVIDQTAGTITNDYGEWGGGAALSSSGTDMKTSFTTLALRAEKELLLGASTTTLHRSATASARTVSTRISR